VILEENIVVHSYMKQKTKETRRRPTSQLLVACWNHHWLHHLVHLKPCSEILTYSLVWGKIMRV